MTAAPTLARALETAQWDATAETDVRRVRLGARLPAVLDSLRGLPVIALMRDGRRVGTLVYQVTNGTEYFVAVLAGDSTDEGGNLLDEFLPQLCEHGRSLGCTVIRGLTERPGMVRALTHSGWSVAAVLMQKPI